MRCSPFRRLRATLPLVALLALGGCSTSSLSFFDNDSTPNGDAPTTAEKLIDLDVLLRIADSSRLSGDFASAERVYARAHELHPDAVEPLVGLGRLFKIGRAHV